jgi:hypothetical protein
MCGCAIDKNLRVLSPACTRKLLTMVNAVVKRGTPWMERCALNAS